MRSLAIALLLALAAPAIAADLDIAQQSVEDADAWLDIVRERVVSLKAERKVAQKAERTASQLLETALVTGDETAVATATNRLNAAVERTARLDSDITEALAERQWAADQLVSARTMVKEARGA